MKKKKKKVVKKSKKQSPRKKKKKAAVTIIKTSTAEAFDDVQTTDGVSASDIIITEADGEMDVTTAEDLAKEL